MSSSTATKNKKQRFMCHDCKQTYMHTTNTLMANSHYTQSIWIDFIQDTLYGKTLDGSAEKYGFSHQTAFNMRHKVLMALQDLLEKILFFFPVLLNLMKHLSLTATKEAQSRNRQAAKPVNTVQKRPNEGFQRNISRSVQASNVMEVSLPQA